jgi:hypothetical protein
MGPRREDTVTISFTFILIIVAAIAAAFLSLFLLLLRMRKSPPQDNVLQVIQSLQRSGALWPQIMAELNPRNDRQTQQLLVELRGPHMFAPHVALNLLENACQVLDNRGDHKDVARLACENMKKITEFGR